MKFSLRTKLALSFSFLALILVASISFISNVFLQKQFSDYMMKQQESKNSEMVRLIKQEYNTSANTFDSAGIESIGVSALEQGLIVKVLNSQNTSVWDATVHNNGLCKQMMDNISADMATRYPAGKGGFEEKSYPLILDAKTIGQVKIGYYGPFYLTENDSAYLKALNNILIGIGFISFIIALFFGSYLAKRISSPISKTIKAAEQISEGNYGNQINVNSSTKEIDDLVNTINHLSVTLKNQDMLRKRLTSDVAHELRTPLTTLQSHLEAMLDGIWEVSRERLISIKEEILRLTKLVGDLEELAKYERENLKLEKTEFDIKKLLQKSLQNFETELKIKNMKASIKGNALPIFADKDKINQVFINIFSNAIKYSSDNGQIETELNNNENWLEISIKDTGIGISSEDLPHIFERFYRADQSRNRITGGAGIGLSIVKAIVDAHNGKIEVKSEQNKGTEFKIFLPLN